jgi:hypothetical protein
MFATFVVTFGAEILWPFGMISYAVGAMESSNAFQDIGRIDENTAYIQSAVTHFWWSILIAHCVTAYLVFLRYAIRAPDTLWCCVLVWRYQLTPYSASLLLVASRLV